METNDCPSGLYSTLNASDLAKVRQEKLTLFLKAKQELDEVDTEQRIRQWRTGLIERGINHQRQLEIQRLEAESFRIINEGRVRGAPKGAFGRNGNNSNRKRKTSILSDTNEAAVLEMLASLG